MSNKVSVLVYSRKVGSPVRKAVLVYFAERASDGGEGIWASKSTIADAIECGRSTVIRTINEFVAEGILTAVGTRKHRNGETIEYAMNLAAIEALPTIKDNPSRNNTSPAAELVPEKDRSRPDTPPIPQRDPYPSRSGTQTTNKTIIEPSDSNGARDVLLTVLSPDTADAFIDHRRTKRAKLTVKAAQLIAKDLTHHPNPDAVVEVSIKNGWTGVFPEKFGGPHDQSRPHIDRRQQAADAAFANRLAAAARARPASG